MIFFIDDNGYLEWFKSKRGLENKLEAVDVKNGLYRIFDEQGFELNLLTKFETIKPKFFTSVELEVPYVGEVTQNNEQSHLLQLMKEKLQKYCSGDYANLDFESAKKAFVSNFEPEDEKFENY